jgi:glycopeptide antibiotics resistance protein
LRLARNLVLLASVGLIAAFTLTPKSGGTSAEFSQLGDILQALRHSDPDLLLEVLLEAAANVLLFVPFGASLGLRGSSIGMTAFYGLILSAAIESAQWLLVSGRTASLEDVLLNTLGAVLGQGLLSRVRPAG